MTLHTQIKMQNKTLKIIENKNGLRALMIFDHDNTPVVHLSVESRNVDLNENEFIIKNYSENAEIVKLLIGNGILFPTGRYVNAGRRFCPVCRLAGFLNVEIIKL